MGADDLDAFAEALEAGERVALGIVPATDPDPEPTEKAVTEHVLRLLDVLGLDPDTVSDQLVITPACGLAGAAPDVGAPGHRAVPRGGAQPVVDVAR